MLVRVQISRNHNGSGLTTRLSTFDSVSVFFSPLTSGNVRATQECRGGELRRDQDGVVGPLAEPRLFRGPAVRVQEEAQRHPGPLHNRWACSKTIVAAGFRAGCLFINYRFQLSWLFEEEKVSEKTRELAISIALLLREAKRNLFMLKQTHFC